MLPCTRKKKGETQYSLYSELFRDLGTSRNHWTLERKLDFRSRRHEEDEAERREPGLCRHMVKSDYFLKIFFSEKGTFVFQEADDNITQCP